MDYRRSKLKDFSILSYVSEEQLHEVIVRLYKSNSLAHYMYILHNQDTTVPHYHIYLVFNIKVQFSKVLMFFDGYKDSEGKKINTFVEPVFHPDSMFDYFIHNTEEAQKDKKHLYNVDEVVSDNVDFFRNLTPSIKEDSASSVINDLMLGVSVLECIDKYGRDFIIYYSKYRDLLHDIGYVYDYNTKSFYERSVQGEDRDSSIRPN